MCNFCKHCGQKVKSRGLVCSACVAKIRRYKLKVKAVEYLGGKCMRCGFDKHLAALEFHHRDPASKELMIAKHGNRPWEFVKKELEKCDLLCSNCHRIEHSKYDETCSLVMEAGESAKLTE